MKVQHFVLAALLGMFLRLISFFVGRQLLTAAPGYRR
jgi:hypothetical protein